MRSTEQDVYNFTELRFTIDTDQCAEFLVLRDDDEEFVAEVGADHVRVDTVYHRGALWVRNNRSRACEQAGLKFQYLPLGSALATMRTIIYWLVLLFAARCHTDHNRGHQIGSCMGGSRIYQLPGQGVCELSIGVFEGSSSSASMPDDHADSTMTRGTVGAMPFSIVNHPSPRKKEEVFSVQVSVRLKR